MCYNSVFVDFFAKGSSPPLPSPPAPLLPAPSYLKPVARESRVRIPSFTSERFGCDRVEMSWFCCSLNEWSRKKRREKGRATMKMTSHNRHYDRPPNSSDLRARAWRLFAGSRRRSCMVCVTLVEVDSLSGFTESSHAGNNPSPPCNYSHKQVYIILSLCFSDSERLLDSRPIGCFLIRVSESRFGYTLSFR